MKDTLEIYVVVILVALLLSVVLSNFRGTNRPRRRVAMASLMAGTTGWIYAELVSSLKWGWKLQNEARFSSENWKMNVFFIFINILLLSLIALTPSIFIGYLYHKRSSNGS